MGTTDRVAAREQQWDGALDRSDYSDGFVRGRDELAEAARDAQWERVLGLLRDPKGRLMADHWRVGGMTGPGLPAPAASTTYRHWGALK